MTVKYVIKNLKKCRLYADFQHYLWYNEGMENKVISNDELNKLSKETISLLYLQTFEMLQNLQAQNASLIAQVEDLKQQMAILINQRFGRHSEKLSQLPGCYPSTWMIRLSDYYLDSVHQMMKAELKKVEHFRFSNDFHFSTLCLLFL